MDYTVQVTLKEERLEEVIIGAIEGGIGYWACLNNTTEDFKHYYDTTDLATSEIVWQLLKNGKSVELFDVEDDDIQWALTLEKLLNGLRRHDNFNFNAFDASDYDCIIQYALFDEVVYG